MYIAYSEGNLSRSHTLNKKLQSAGPELTLQPRGAAVLSMKFVLVTIVLIAIFSFGAIVHAYAGDGYSPSVSVSVANVSSNVEAAIPSDQVVVSRGDTLWSIASSRVEQGGNVRSYIEEVKRVNHLRSASLREGQVLLLP